jgi:hypothetical protein
LTGENNVGVWNWDDNHYLGDIKMFPLAWRNLQRSVYKTMGEGSPAREYIFTGLYDNQKELREAYSNAPNITNQYAETIYSGVNKIQKKTIKNYGNGGHPPHHDYPEKMMPLVHHHYKETSKFISSK